MFEIPLHAGSGHPALTLVVLSSLGSFAVGVGVGTFAQRIAGSVTGTPEGSTE